MYSRQVEEGLVKVRTYVLARSVEYHTTIIIITTILIILVILVCTYLHVEGLLEEMKQYRDGTTVWRQVPLSLAFFSAPFQMNVAKNVFTGGLMIIIFMNRSHFGTSFIACYFVVNASRDTA